MTIETLLISRTRFPVVAAHAPYGTIRRPAHARRNPVDFWAALLLVINLIGMQLVLYIPAYLDVPSRTAMVPARVVALMVAMVCVAMGARTYGLRLNSAPVLLAALFWSIYLYRFYLDTFHRYVPNTAVPDALDLATLILGVVLPAFLAGMSVPDIECYAGAYRWIWGCAVLVCLLGFQFNWPAMRQFSLGERMGGNSYQSPIYFGHAGATAILMAIYGLSRPEVRYKPILVIGSVLAGAAALVLAATRSSLLVLALLLPMTVLIILLGRRTSQVWLVVAMMAALLTIPLIASKARLAGVDINRMLTTQDDSIESRRVAIETAVRQFVDHPILGDCLFERAYYNYPHNTIVEAFMATGIVGGACYVALIGLGLYRAVRLALWRRDLAWLSLLYCQAMLFVMFSSSLYTSPESWYMIGIFSCCTLPSAARSQAGRPSR